MIGDKLCPTRAHLSLARVSIMSMITILIKKYNLHFSQHNQSNHYNHIKANNLQNWPMLAYAIQGSSYFEHKKHLKCLYEVRSKLPKEILVRNIVVPKFASINFFSSFHLLKLLFWQILLNFLLTRTPFFINILLRSIFNWRKKL